VELNTRSNGMQWLAILLTCADREGRYTLRPSQDIFMIIAGSITSGKREISFPLTAPSVRHSHRARAVIDSVFVVKLRHPLNALWERHFVAFSRLFQKFAWDYNR